MKAQLERLQRAVVIARQKQAAAQALLAKAESQAKTAKARSRQLKIAHKRARAAAKQRKLAVLRSREAVEANARVLAKAEKRLAKGYQKFGKQELARQAPPRNSSSIKRLPARARQIPARPKPPAEPLAAGLPSVPVVRGSQS